MVLLHNHNCEKIDIIIMIMRNTSRLFSHHLTYYIICCSAKLHGHTKHKCVYYNLQKPTFCDFQSFIAQNYWTNFYQNHTLYVLQHHYITHQIWEESAYWFPRNVIPKSPKTKFCFLLWALLEQFSLLLFVSSLQHE